MIAFRSLLLAAACCGGDAARLELVPIDRSCGLPANPNQLAITAYADSVQVTKAVGIGQPVDIGDFPLDTKQLGVEIVIGGGVNGAIGKTLPLELAELASGTAIPVFMAPPNGFCNTGDMIEARRAPLVARAGDGALIVGGFGDTGPLVTAEFYDARTAAFTDVVVPEALRDTANGFAGVVLTTLPDGRVALTGGSRGLLTIFDPESGAFGATLAIAPPRAFHGAVATPNGLLVAGGCADVQTQTCAPLPLRSTVEYTLDAQSQLTGPNLAIDAVAEGGQLFDLGSVFVLAGGFGTPGEVHRFAFTDLEATKLTGLRAQPVALDGGALLTAFAPDGAPASGAVTVLAPSGAVVDVGPAPMLDGARLVALEDGAIVGFGGGAEVAHYNPTFDDWELDPVVGEGPGVLAAPSTVRIGDGTVLVVGGDAAPSRIAYIYRPSLVGPMSGTLSASPASVTSPGVLVPSDPRTVTRGAMWTLTSPDDSLSARALLGGPRMQRGVLAVTANVEGGLALIAQQVAPDRALVAHLIPGEPVRLEQLGEGVVCTGARFDPPAGAVDAQLTVGDGVEVRIGESVVLACDYAATGSGAWGVAASGTNARIAVATVAVTR